MNLTLIERPDGSGDPEGFTPRWWAPRLHQDNSTFWAVVDEQDNEVARVEMVDATWPGNYVGVVDSPDFIKIHLIEVHAERRHHGFATATLGLPTERYIARRLLAFSEAADEFWETTGWSRHIHRDDDPAAPRHQVLFIQPV